MSQNDEPTMHSEPDAAAPVAWLEGAILAGIAALIVIAVVVLL